MTDRDAVRERCKHGHSVCVACTGEHGGAWEGRPRDRAVDIVASEIGDAIAAHDAGEKVNPETRAKHVVAALAAVSRPAEARGEADMSPRLLAINLADAAPVTTREAADRVALHYRQLCALKPERYEVFLAGKGYSHKLSDAVAYLQDAAPRPEPGEPSEARDA